MSDGNYTDARYEGKEPYIFISYRHRDKASGALFDKLLSMFRKGGYRVWYDAQLHAGENWGEELINHIEYSYVFLALMSNQYFQSKDCITEMHFAMAEEKRILPIECETIISRENRYMQNKIDANYQKITDNHVDKIFEQIWIMECLDDSDKRDSMIQETISKEESAPEEHSEQITQSIMASSAEDAMSDALVERKINKMFEDEHIVLKATTEEKRFFFSKPRLVFTPDEIAAIYAGVLKLLRSQQTELRMLLYGVQFQGSRMAYKTALTTVKIVKLLAEKYNFWTYQQNQKINYFISDSAPLLRLMHGRAIREEHKLSENMIAAVKSFASELDRLIDCLEV